MSPGTEAGAGANGGASSGGSPGSGPGNTLEQLLDLRTRAHRLGSDPPMTSVAELADWLAARRIVLVSGRSALPSAAEAIAGEAISGSWWGHAQGHLIYRLLSELSEDAAAGSELVLIEGKRTLVARDLVPLVTRLALDGSRVERVVAGLDATSRRLWDALADGEELRSGDTDLRGSAWRSARSALESGLLARSESEHTEAGHHASTLSAVSSLRPLDDDTGAGMTRPGGSAGSYEEDLSALYTAAVNAAVVAERREVDKWLRLVEPDAAARRAAIDRLRPSVLRTNGREWLTLD